MLVQEIETTLPAAEVIRRARAFFAHAGPCGGCPTGGGPAHVRFDLDMGEVVLGVLPGADGRSLVRGSASRGAGLIGRFLCTLGPPADVRRIDPHADRRG
jgi:hypothetical protein